jgi:hypothetical protein
MPRLLVAAVMSGAPLVAVTGLRLSFAPERIVEAQPRTICRAFVKAAQLWRASLQIQALPVRLGNSSVQRLNSWPAVGLPQSAAI